MPDFDLRHASLDDVALLAEMNQQLIIDEGGRNTMTLPELKKRMHEWLTTDYKAVVVERDKGVIGYLLYRKFKEQYFPYNNSVYIRQFFIQPSYRRRGIGQTVFETIADEYFPKDYSVMLDVLESNPEGKAFWVKLGFSIYHTTLRRERL